MKRKRNATNHLLCLIGGTDTAGQIKMKTISLGFCSRAYCRLKINHLCAENKHGRQNHNVNAERKNMRSEKGTQMERVRAYKRTKKRDTKEWPQNASFRRIK